MRARPSPAHGFIPANPDLPRAESGPALLGYRAYVAALAKVVYYWGYPLVGVFGRTGQWRVMKEPGLLAGMIPAAPVNRMAYLDDYLPAAQRWVVMPSHDTLYGSGLTDLRQEPVVLQAPIQAPAGQYWSIQVGDAFTNIVHQLGSRPGTAGGKYLVTGPGWKGEPPADFQGVLPMPTNLAWIVPRCFMAHTAESRGRALSLLGQIGMYPLSEDRPGLWQFDLVAVARNVVYPPGTSAERIATHPDAYRPQWVNPTTFWRTLDQALAMNPEVGPNDEDMAEQALTLLALYAADPIYRGLLDLIALEAHDELHAGARCQHVGVDVGGGWQQLEHVGAWGTDWFGRAQAAVLCIMVNDRREALSFLRGTDNDGWPLRGRYRYTVTFPPDALPPVDRTRGGFWSLTLYGDDYFMLHNAPNGRANVGTINLEADELMFGPDGSLTITISRDEPADAIGKANWLPAPDDAFALVCRTFVPAEPLLDGRYVLPNVVRAG